MGTMGHRDDLIQRASAMKYAGYNNTEIARTLFLSERDVREMLQSEPPARMAENEISNLAQEVTLDTAVRKIVTYIRQEYDLTTDEAAKEYWLTMLNVDKLEVVRTVLQ